MDLYRSQTEMKREAQQKRIKITSEHLKQKTNEKRISNLTRLIGLTKDEILAFKEMPELQAKASNRLRKYYEEFERLDA